MTLTDGAGTRSSMMENNTLIPDHFNTPGLGSPLSDRKLRLEELRVKVKKLNALVGDLDPYQPLSVEVQAELRSFGVLVLDDPFAITNQLVIILEDMIEELQRLETELSA